MPPLLSVLVTTYNHGPWLGECLESIVNQETSFPFEIIVGDDASSDGRTQDVLREWAARRPDLITAVFREKNVNQYWNIVDLFARSSGKYVAVMDGDDVMLRGKLQFQVDLLEKRPEFTLSAHRMLLLPAADQLWDTVGGPEHGTVYDLLRIGTYFCSSSVMYRRDAFVPGGDYNRFIEAAALGDIHYAAHVLGGYRRHPGQQTGTAAYVPIVFEAYEKAYDRANELGLERSAVERGRMRHRTAAAVAALRREDYSAFRRHVALSPEQKRHASIEMRVLSSAAFVAPLLRWPYLARRTIYSIYRRLSFRARATLAGPTTR